MTLLPAEQQPATATDEERLARAYLVRVAEPPAAALVAFVGERGPVEAAARVRSGDCPEKVRRETAARREVDKAEEDLEAAAKTGARLVVPEDHEWPAWPLLSLAVASGRGVENVAAPLALWVRGEASLVEAADRAVAVVGARMATNYGVHNAAELAHGLAVQGVPVFSGAAMGIDGAAHRGALSADGVTVAALGCAVDVAYPAGHVDLLKRIAGNGGAVISEYAPGTPPARHRFLVRNRLIAGLTDGTVVIEAGIRSGARNTATTAGALGKVVMALPGPVQSGNSAGCHALIRDCKATLVTSVEEVVETVGRFGPRPEEDRPRTKRPTDGLAPEALRVYEALVPRAGRWADQVATESGVPVDRVRALLPELEIDGFAVRGDTGWRRIVRSAAR
ncbi:DNA-processing protein DprA [Amycolatopsis sp. FDAARGOS 1241]|uniref:DNA-processing protein DprA n=1 Tax=Amycolatopsis sp. FDAARGOS 1241 TaxID=2778070 RepID=UPI00195278B9|nr:DNA-processing protein DprA [Amycolatopsis sp. FDAARGOS 1241]QRP44337.1 DNA-protecting protein DprA [Amycolatopsis sp. FDAARGOS 1241]